MKLVLSNTDEIKKVDGDVVASGNVLFSHFLVTKKEDGIYITSGYFENDTFKVLDVEKPTYFISSDKAFDMNKFIELFDSDELGDYAKNIAYSI